MSIIHLAPVGPVYEGPGLEGRAVVILKAPVASLCGSKVSDGNGNVQGTQVIAPHDDSRTCKACLKLLPSRTSHVIPLLLG